MASKNTKRCKDSIDDVLGDLLGDDDPSPSSKPLKKSPMTTGPSNRSRSITSKKSPLDDDFYAQLAKDTAEDSDVSEVDAQALLESLKDWDDMDAELFGSKKPKSAPAKDSGMSKITGSDLKPQDKTADSKG